MITAAKFDIMHVKHLFTLAGNNVRLYLTSETSHKFMKHYMQSTGYMESLGGEK